MFTAPSLSSRILQEGRARVRPALASSLLWPESRNVARTWSALRSNTLPHGTCTPRGQPLRSTRIPNVTRGSWLAVLVWCIVERPSSAQVRRGVDTVSVSHAHRVDGTPARDGLRRFLTCGWVWQSGRGSRRGQGPWGSERLSPPSASTCAGNRHGLRDLHLAVVPGVDDEGRVDGCGGDHGAVGGRLASAPASAVCRRAPWQISPACGSRAGHGPSDEGSAHRGRAREGGIAGVP